MLEFLKSKIKDLTFFDSALALAGLTAVAYLSAYLYERSYLDYFGIGDLAKVETESLLKAAFVVVIITFLTTAALVLLLVANKSQASSNELKWTDILRYSLFIAIICFAGGPILYAVDPGAFSNIFRAAGIAILVIVPVMVGLMVVALQVRSLRKGATRARDLHFLKSVSKFLGTVVERQLIIAVPLFVVVLFIGNAFFLGFSQARSQDNFMSIMVDDKEALVLTEQDPFFIAEFYDKSSNKLTGEFLYINKLSEERLNFKMKNVKPEVDEAILKKIRDNIY